MQCDFFLRPRRDVTVRGDISGERVGVWPNGREWEEEVEGVPTPLAAAVHMSNFWHMSKKRKQVRAGEGEGEHKQTQCAAGG